MNMEMEQEKEKVQGKAKQQQLEWRRNQVLELSSQGRTEREIAQILKVGNGTVHRDLAYLNKIARENLQVHIQERLPEQYQKCCNGLTQVLKMAWNIAIIDNVNHATKLQALSLISDCYKYQMDLTTNGVIITDAIKYVNGRMEHLNNQEKKLLQDIKDKDRGEGKDENTNFSDSSSSSTESQTETEQTTNDIF